jgi:hypothetical protein
VKPKRAWLVQPIAARRGGFVEASALATAAMSQSAALPLPPARTMLTSVLGSAHPQKPRAAGRWRRLALLALLALSAALPARAALAQDAGDAGWFDPPPTAEPAPEPYYDEPVVGDPAPAPAPTSDVPDTDPSALTTFRPALDPYGAWVTDSRYGTVWVPNRDVVGPDFAPYVSRGHWALTADDDWIWTSDYPFGWAVFHYGRWGWIPGNGWAWVPGRTYANAWVVWRVPTAGYAYVGWAPMPPTWGWRNGYAFGLYYSPPLPYVFCPSAYAFDYRVHYHIVRDRHLVRDIASHTRVHPTPYHAPAQPSRHTASNVRPAPAPIGASRAPRGPAISSARVPASAVPAIRTAPPPKARLANTRLADVTRQRAAAGSDARLRSSSSPRIPAGTRDVRRSAPDASWSNAPRTSAPRTSAPARVRVEPRTAAPRTSAPARIRVEPRNVAPRTVAPRAVAPARIRVSPSPSRSFSPAPSRSMGPASPRSHGGGRRR